MNSYTETAIERHFDTHQTLTVTLVDEKGESKEEIFHDQYNAIRDCNNLEGEYDVYYDMEIRHMDDLL